MGKWAHRRKWERSGFEFYSPIPRDHKQTSSPDPFTISATTAQPRRHKDGGILTEANEANEGLSNAKPVLGSKPFVAFCKISSECLLTAASPEEKGSVSKPWRFDRFFHSQLGLPF